MATSASAAAPLAAPLPADLEQGNGPNADLQSQDIIEEAFSNAYYVAYGLSLFVLTLGMWAFFFSVSNSHLVSSILGWGGLIIGVFLVLNTDLLVTYARLVRETGRLKQSNKNYRSGLAQQKKIIKELTETEKAVQRFDAMCGGSMEQLQEELNEMRENSKMNTQRNIGGFFMVTRPQGQDFKAGGRELDAVLQTLSNTYIQAFPHVDVRFAEMHKGFQASGRWNQMQTVSCNRLKHIIISALFEKVEDIKESVREKLDAETDELASGVSQVFETPTAAPKRDSWSDALAFVGLGSSGGKKEASPAAAPKRDSWADAMEFVGLGSSAGKEEKAPAPMPSKEDSWADAINFVGTDK